MIIGVPKEIKSGEHRVGLTPASVAELHRHGHQVLVQAHAGDSIDLDNQRYQLAGAEIVQTAGEVFDRADLVVKVKEPLDSELDLLRPGQALFTYLHLAPAKTLTERLVATGATAIAYETVTDRHGNLPLLTPMSQIAGRMSVQAGAHCLELAQQGRGILLGGIPGTAPASVVVLGGGIVGSNAARIALGMGADVTVVNRSLEKLTKLDALFGPAMHTAFSSAQAIEELVLAADIVIGAALVPGGAAPKLVSGKLVESMRRGAVLVDVSIDQGGCFETSRPTTHAEPTYLEHDVVHYCVANMPGAVARTSATALNHATLPFVLALANQGVQAALQSDPHLRQGLNVHAGKVTYQAVAEATGHEYVDAEALL
ncbi:MAG: alanine dehydrogenase [Pseudomonadales bacterium]